MGKCEQGTARQLGTGFVGRIKCFFKRIFARGSGMGAFGTTTAGGQPSATVDGPRQIAEQPRRSGFARRAFQAVASQVFENASASAAHGAATKRQLSACMRSVEATGNKLVRIGSDRALTVRWWHAPFRTFRARQSLASIAERLRGMAVELAGELNMLRQIVRDHYFNGPVAALFEHQTTFPGPDLPDDAAALLIPLPESITGDARRRLEQAMIFTRLSGIALRNELKAARAQQPEADRGGPEHIAIDAVGEATVLAHLIGRGQRTVRHLIELAQGDDLQEHGRVPPEAV